MRSSRTHTLVVLAWAALASSCTPERVRYQPSTAVAIGTEQASAVLYLVGDAGEANPQRDEVLEHLGQDVERLALSGQGPPIVVAFLGDNVYEEGVPTEWAPGEARKLEGQVHSVARHANVRGLFVPGNHDWGNGGSLEAGRAAIERQRVALERMADGRSVALVPGNGCPGPVTENLGEAAYLVFIDTEWLLRAPEDGCGSVEAFYDRLGETLRQRDDRPRVLLSHHPLVSGGPHGGNVSALERGPLVYYLAVKGGALRQDLASPAYSAAREGIAAAIAAGGAPPLAHAAGHDHGLQVIRMGAPGEPSYQLVSGAASRTEAVRRLDGTRYATDGFGYMRLDFLERGVRVVVFARAVESGPVRPVYACMLSQGPEGCPEAPLLGDGG